MWVMSLDFRREIESKFLISGDSEFHNPRWAKKDYEMEGGDGLMFSRGKCANRWMLLTWDSNDSVAVLDETRPLDLREEGIPGVVTFGWGLFCSNRQKFSFVNV